MKSTTKKYVILAPHPDDELIGCFKILKNKEVEKVIYFYELNDIRKKEAIECSKLFEFEPIFVEKISNDFQFSNDKILLVPNIHDNHVAHKAINQIAKQQYFKKMYYSVDMNVPYTILSKEEKETKEYLLKKIYKSQIQLFQNEKYFLFESLVDSDIDKYIYITTSYEGFHKYPNAPKKVSFLRNEHRHMFHVKVKVQVFDNDREIEFIMFKHEIDKFIKDKTNMNYKSCEMMAEEILLYVNKNYQNRNIYVTVNEDNENGSEVKYEIWN